MVVPGTKKPGAVPGFEDVLHNLRATSLPGRMVRHTSAHTRSHASGQAVAGGTINVGCNGNHGNSKVAVKCVQAPYPDPEQLATGALNRPARTRSARARLLAVGCSGLTGRLPLGIAARTQGIGEKWNHACHVVFARVAVCKRVPDIRQHTQLRIGALCQRLHDALPVLRRRELVVFSCSATSDRLYDYGEAYCSNTCCPVNLCVSLLNS